MTSGNYSTPAWFVYIIRSRRGRLYTGITVDPWRRWQEHCSGRTGAKFFRTDKPEALVLVESSADRGSASRREAAIKKLTAREKRQLIRCQAPCPLPRRVQATGTDRQPSTSLTETYEQ